MAASVFSIWFFWGSTFAGMRYAVGSIPPFAMISMRFTCAGLVLWTVCWALGAGRPTRRAMRDAVVCAVFLLVLGTGVTAWTVQFLPTGMNALLLSLAPIWMASIEFAWKRRLPSRTAVVGMAVGIGGIALLLQPHATGGLPAFPVALVFLASASWAFGSIYQRYAPTANPLLSSALQMLCAGIITGAEALATGEWARLDLSAVTPSAWAGLAWLIVFGSLVAYSAYLYTMRTGSVALASTYAYVNPVVSIGLGMLLFHERLTPLEGTASAIVLAGVALMLLPANVARRGLSFGARNSL